MMRTLAVGLMMWVGLAAAGSQALAFSGEDVVKGNPWHHLDLTTRAAIGDNEGAATFEGAGFSAAAAREMACVPGQARENCRLTPIFPP